MKQAKQWIAAEEKPLTPGGNHSLKCETSVKGDDGESGIKLI